MLFLTLKTKNLLFIFDKFLILSFEQNPLRSLLANELNIDARSVHAYIIGEHGDSEVPVWSTANVAGQKLLSQDWEKLSSSDRQELTAVFDRVKNAAYEIIQRKGYTSYAIGLVVTDIVKAILRSQERVLTVSGLVEGLYGIENVCLGLPRVVNERGILKTVNLNLSYIEEEQLRHSANVLQEVFTSLSIMAGRERKLSIAILISCCIQSLSVDLMMLYVLCTNKNSGRELLTPTTKRRSLW